MIFNINKNKLTFLLQYSYSDGYSLKEKMKEMNINKILEKFKKNIDNKYYVNILSKFNGLHYPMHDLDTQENLDLFKRINKDIPYVIFQSSEGGGTGRGKTSTHHWAFLDSPQKKLKDIFYEHSWKVCNDQKYVEFCNNYNYITIRGLYNSNKDRPYVVETNGELSTNFDLFIKSLKKYYFTTGFELSVLYNKDHELLEELMIRKRKEKIEKILSRDK